MGTYYKMACDDLKESIDPGDINGLGIKEFAIAYPTHPFGPVIVFAMLERWKGHACRLVNDLTDDPGYFDYRNVTREVIEDYNARYPDAKPLRYTGDD